MKESVLVLSKLRKNVTLCRGASYKIKKPLLVEEASEAYRKLRF
jgi:hypothetical protein